MARERDERDGSAPGVLAYKLYGQDGNFVHMTCADTPSMREFTEWVRIHDRHTVQSSEKVDG